MIVNQQSIEKITLFNTPNNFVTISANSKEKGSGVQEYEHGHFCSGTDKSSISKNTSTAKIKRRTALLIDQEDFSENKIIIYQQVTKQAFTGEK